MRTLRLLTPLALVAGLAVSRAPAQDLNEALEKATKEAVRKVAPSVVQIVTQGGTDMVVATAKGAAFRKALGPTTGVVVSEDGYIVSSLFNFLNDPTTILVGVPGREEPVVAKRVANDRSRMLTLLKIDAKGLPVPSGVARKEIQEGQFTVALGRTLDVKRSAPPSVSVGIVSALDRIWGKAIQTDAKISPLNYGGPLVDFQGRVQGILIPASPQGEEVTAGFEWYDSGIGFAIPFEDVLAVLPKLKQGKDLYKGILGIGFKGQDLYSLVPEIGLVSKDSAAEKAGLKPGDKIVEVEGRPVTRRAQLQHVLGTRYEGEKVSLKYERDGKVVEVKDLTLVSSLQPVTHAYLGILAMRDDPKTGVRVRHVFPKSPAEAAGIKPGERILSAGVSNKNLLRLAGGKAGRDVLADFLNTQPAGAEVWFEVEEENDSDVRRVLPVTLDALAGSLPGAPWAVPEKLPYPASLAKAREPLEAPKGKGPVKGKGDPKEEAKKDEPKKDEPKFEAGLKLRATGDGETQYWVYLPKNYTSDITHGVVLWLHPPGRNRQVDVDELVETWETVCHDQNLILVYPKSENAEGWIASEASSVVACLQDTLKAYAVDRQRIVAHGMGVGGQMALYLGLNHRDVIRGVATVGAVPTAFKDNVANQRLAFWLAAGELDPLVKSVSEARTKLAEKRFSAVFREIPNRGREYLTDSMVLELARWIDCLDKR